MGLAQVHTCVTASTILPTMAKRVPAPTFLANQPLSERLENGGWHPIKGSQIKEQVIKSEQQIIANTHPDFRGLFFPFRVLNPELLS